MKLAAFYVILVFYSPLALFAQRLIPPRSYSPDDDDDDHRGEYIDEDEENENNSTGNYLS